MHYYNHNVMFNFKCLFWTYLMLFATPCKSSKLNEDILTTITPTTLSDISEITGEYTSDITNTTSTTTGTTSRISTNSSELTTSPTLTSTETLKYEGRLETENCDLPQCTSCTQAAGICYLCGEGYYIGPKNQCKECPGNCTRCNEEGCVHCEQGFFREKKNKTCIACEVPFCERCSMNQTCVKCVDGHYLEGGFCRECQPSNCKTCHKTGFLFKCDSCPVGHLRVREVVCVKACEDNCTTCDVKVETQSIECMRCKLGHYLLKGHCFACPDNCLKCHINSASKALVCNTCQPSYYLTDKIKCAACDAGDWCISCVRALPHCETCLVKHRVDEDARKGCVYDTSQDCYTCTKNCAVSIHRPRNNITTGYCKGLNRTSSCSSLRVMQLFTSIIGPTNGSTNTPVRSVTKARTLSYAYSCETEVCEQPGEQDCRYNPITMVMVCSTCCGSRTCNTNAPPGIGVMSEATLNTSKPCSVILPPGTRVLPLIDEAEDEIGVEREIQLVHASRISPGSRITFHWLLQYFVIFYVLLVAVMARMADHGHRIFL